MTSSISSDSSAQESGSEYGIRQRAGWLLGPGILLLTLLLDPPTGLSVEGWRTAGVAGLMATFWICESIPIPVTALLPFVLFPALQLAGIRETAAPYANPIIYLFFGGFILAMGMQKWNLHKRVAIHLISRVGTSPTRVVAGFMITSAFLSMWCSNTATTMMLLPIALSVTALFENKVGESGNRKICAALMLAVAYGATTGGMGTLIGTPPTAMLAGYMDDLYGIQIGFAQWMLIGIPIVIVTLVIVYFVLTRIVYRLDTKPVPEVAELIREQKSGLGKMSREEKMVAMVFILTAGLWVFQPLLTAWLPMLSDTVIAMAGAMLLFLVPVSLKRGEFLMDWKTAKGLPWDVLILFGGGLSLAANIQNHGLSQYLGEMCKALDGIPLWLILVIVSFSILMITELTSNTATAATFLPVAAAVGVSLGENPLLFMIPTVLAANCSYMLPVGTPPNAIVFGSGMIRLPEMARAGMLLNIAMVPVLVCMVWFLAPFIFDVEFGTLPEWVGTLLTE